MPGVAVAVDRLGFTAALENLVQNAIDAARGRITVSGFAENGHAVVDVTDDGPGMTADFIRNDLFRPFASTKSTGYGIGIYETRDLNERWGGLGVRQRSRKRHDGSDAAAACRASR